MTIWKEPGVSVQPEVTLRKWSFIEIPTGDIHLLGQNQLTFRGRMSTRVVSFDLETMKCKTQSGRIYQLDGASGFDGDAAYVWSQQWAGLSRDVSAQVLSGEKVFSMEGHSADDLQSLRQQCWVTLANGHDFEALSQAIERERPQAVFIAAADLELNAFEALVERVRAHTWLYWLAVPIDGRLSEKGRQCWQALAPHNATIRIVDIGSLAVATLSCAFDRRVWMPPAEPVFASRVQMTSLPLDERGTEGAHGQEIKRDDFQLSLFPGTLEALEKFRIPVLITYEAPAAWEAHGFREIDELACKLEPAMHFYIRTDSETRPAGACGTNACHVQALAPGQVFDLEGKVIPVTC